MAVKKSQLGLGSGSGIQATDLHSIVSQEQDVLTGSLETGRELTKNKNLNKLGGARTKVVYFHQVPRDRNNYLVNINGLSDIDPNLTQYIKIEQFVLKLEALDTSWEEGDNGGPKSPMFDGKITILPNTVLPYANDRFLVKYQNRTRLFKITEASPVSADDQTAYELSCSLEDSDFVYDGSTLQGMVVDEYVFEESHIGSDFRTVFRKSEYETFYSLKKLYHTIGKVYMDQFYNKILNTFILRYENNLEELQNQGASSSFTVLTKDGKSEEGRIIEPIDNLEFVKDYEGKEMYDAELIEFMIKNRIFDEIGFSTTLPTQFVSNKKQKTYNYTIFNALETRDRSRFKNKYQLPIELNIASPAAQPVMFGKISLLHVASRADSTLTLFPSNLANVISATINDVIPALDFRAGNVFDKIVYLIALYINKFDRQLTSFLLSIYSQTDDLEQFETSVLTNEVFYLYPILGYITKEVLQQIASSEVTNLLSDPRDYYPKGE